MRSALCVAGSALLIAACSRYSSDPSPYWEQLNLPEQKSSKQQTVETPPAPSPTNFEQRISNNSVSERPALQLRALPKTHLLPVPFTPQAPHRNWDDPYQEACEEAALLMVHRSLQGQHDAIPPDDADKDLLALMRWEERNGYGADVTLKELGEIARRYYGYTPIIEETVTVERIKELVAAGYPVIVPAAGRDLGNPYYSGEGPWYHMLVIRGYDRNEFITNDPGTRRGEGYKYTYDVLIAAVHDWTGEKENIRSGGKRMLILKK